MGVAGRLGRDDKTAPWGALLRGRGFLPPFLGGTVRHLVVFPIQHNHSDAQLRFKFSKTISAPVTDSTAG